MQNVTSTTSESLKALSKPFSQRVWQSFMSALGAIVFGMEDGTVSIFGLVFGVAASATNSQMVLLAGATGALAAAGSMMAGPYPGVSPERGRAQAAVANRPRGIEQTPGARLKCETAFDLRVSAAADRNPVVQWIWMFLADLFAAFVPVLPFAFLPLASARSLSLLVTTMLLLVLGVGRGLIGHKNVLVTAVQTLVIAAAAAIAGLVVGALVTCSLGGS